MPRAGMAVSTEEGGKMRKASVPQVFQRCPEPRPAPPGAKHENHSSNNSNVEGKERLGCYVIARLGVAVPQRALTA